MSTSTAARRAAPLAEILLQATQVVVTVMAGRTPDAALGRVALPLRPATMEAVYTALRAYGRADFFLARLMDRPLKDAEVRALLLLALNRLERAPDDAYRVVDQAVTAAQSLANGRFKGVVNGVLRNFMRQRIELVQAAQADSVATWQHPLWWIERVQRDHPDRWRDILAAGNTHPPLVLRVNRRRLASADFLTQLDAVGIAARRLDDAAVLIEKAVAVDAIPGFRAGLCSVQDWGAQSVPQRLELQDGLRVLDACAAPGGKTAHLLETNDLELTALDVDAARTLRIRQNLDRLGLHATIKTADACAVASWWDGRPFDRILADVPCSASGVARRHPDAKWLRRETDVADLAQRQTAILEALWPTLAPGGKMLYVTCSVFEQENSAQVHDFLVRHKDARRADASLPTALLPNAEHDGFFFVLLQKA